MMEEIVGVSRLLKFKLTIERVVILKSRFFKSLRVCVYLYILCFSLDVLAESLLDERYVGEMHSPVLISAEGKSVVAFFLKNNLKGKIKEYVADGEIYFMQNKPLVLGLNYVWKVEGDRIASVFFYDWNSPERKGRSMFVLTESDVSGESFEGKIYSVMELPVVVEEGELSLVYFKGDLLDSRLQSCYEGIDLRNGSKVSCAYKNAGDIKRYLSTIDG